MSPLSPATVRVWAAELDRSGAAEGAAGILAADERERAERFRFERDRRRFTLARAALRILLGACVRRPPAEIVFVYGPNGKPALAGPGPQFSLAHSADLAVVAIGEGGAPLGVDVEEAGRALDHEALIGDFASAAERAAFAAMAPERRRIAFFHWWTRKESVLKALGAGLSLPLDGFDVSVEPGEPRLLGARLPVLSGRWMLQDIAPAPGYIGAVAVPGDPVRVELCRFSFPFP